MSTKKSSYPINVLHIRDSSGLYGAEQVILNVVKYISKERFNITVLLTNNNTIESKTFKRKIVEKGAEVAFVPVRGRFDISALASIRRFLKLRDIQLIHGHDFKANFYGILASTGLPVKRVVTAHGSTKETLLKKLYLAFDVHISYRYFDKVLPVSRRLAAELEVSGVNPERIQVIQNGIDISLAKSSSTAKIMFGFPRDADGAKIYGVIGRLYPDKGHRFFLEAFKELSMEFPQIRALVVGEGPLREPLSEMIKARGLEGRVQLVGQRDDMDVVYNSIDFIVIPSLTEGLPFVLLEAMLYRLPVVATSVGDIPCLVDHKETGYLVPPSNSLSIKEGMKYLLSNPGEAKHMSDKAHRLVCANFSANMMVKRIEEIYCSLIAVA